jgi:GTP-binding protein
MNAISDYTAHEIANGRRLFSGEWRFLAAASSAVNLPAMRDTEIAFAGRSNVGKSSLINALTGRKALARTSRTPGRTQELIFFGNDAGLTMVDMPGYGYAAAAKSKIASWTAAIHAYLGGRSNLARVYVLIDARHGLKNTDEPTLDVLSQLGVSHQIVLTKIDALSTSELDARITHLETALIKWPAAFPRALSTSARDGIGLEHLRAAVARLLAERRH